MLQEKEIYCADLTDGMRVWVSRWIGKPFNTWTQPEYGVLRVTEPAGSWVWSITHPALPNPLEIPCTAYDSTPRTYGIRVYDAIPISLEDAQAILKDELKRFCAKYRLPEATIFFLMCNEDAFYTPLYYDFNFILGEGDPSQDISKEFVGTAQIGWNGRIRFTVIEPSLLHPYMQKWMRFRKYNIMRYWQPW